MKSFKGKVAVVTGAASGIGRALATYCAQKEMKIVLADIEQSALIQTESDLVAEGADVIAVLTDVSKSLSVETLAQKTLESFGSIHLLFNHAGVATGSTIWGSTLAEINAKVKTSVLCPGWVRTRILNSKRNHPDQIQDKSSHKQQTDNHFAQEDLESGVSPEIVAEHVFHAIREDKFYIFVNADEYKSLIRMRMENILEESNPTLT